MKMKYSNICKSNSQNPEISSVFRYESMNPGSYETWFNTKKNCIKVHFTMFMMTGIGI